MNSTERRLNLLVLLQSNQRWNVDQMAAHFNVSRRTIFRDLRTFSEINLPVTYDKDMGYGMMKGFSIPPIMFSPKELSTILIGLSFVESQVDETLVNDSRAVQYKINSVLPTEELKQFMRTLGEKTIVDPYKKYASSKKKGGDWFTIANAISKHFEIVFNYTSAKDQHVTKRRVKPYLIVYFSDHWTLIGFCTARKGIRSFRLDRLKDVEITPQTFSLKRVPAEKSLLFRSSEDTTEITIRVNQEVLNQFKSTLPSLIVKETVGDGYSDIQFEFDNLDYINTWLFSFHNNVRVLKPKDLVSKRVMLIQDMLRSI